MRYLERAQALKLELYTYIVSGMQNRRLLGWFYNSSTLPIDPDLAAWDYRGRLIEVSTRAATASK